MLITFGRMMAAFGLAMALAIVFGVALGTVGWFCRMFDFWVTIAASVPSLLYIVVVYLWLGLNDIAAGLDTQFEGEFQLAADCTRVAYVFQQPRLLPWLTTVQNVRFVLEAQGQ